MVSIPTSQIKNIIYADTIKSIKDESNQLKKSVTKLSVVKIAENEGYFKNLTAEYLNSKFNKNEKLLNEQNNIEALKNIKYINLHECTLQRLSYLEYCRGLVYLNLSNNFISDISVLRHCSLLKCLDVSCNMIEILPESSFWISLNRLQILYLHNNPISFPFSVSGLRSTPVLEILTLFDTPLYLRKRYRHFIVNSIWSLKLLDFHLVSDEEIIEDANFRQSKFRSVAPLLKMNPFIGVEDDGNLYKVDDNIRMILVKINRISVHTSPVLILQRWTRGYICRKFLKKKSCSTSIMKPVKISEMTVVPTVQETDEEAIEKPASTEPEVKEKQKSGGEVRYLRIDLNQLNQQSTMEALDREAQIMDSVAPGRVLFTYRSVSKSDFDKCSPDQINRALAKSYSVLSHNNRTGPMEQHSFRLQGFIPPKSKDPSSELLIEKNRSHYLIQEADRIFHESHANKQSESLKNLRTKISNAATGGGNKEIFRRKLKGSMAMYLLRQMEVDRHALQTMKRYQECVAKTEAVKQSEDIIRHNIEIAKTEKIVMARTAEHEHRAYVKAGLEKENEQILQSHSEIQDMRQKRLDKREILSEEYNFSIGFRSKQSAACGAIDKFEKLAYAQDQLQNNKAFVSDTRNQMRLEMSNVKDYLDNQAQAKLAARRIDKSKIEMHVLQQANLQFDEAKKRVEKLKGIQRLVSCPHLPIIAIDSHKL